MFRQIIMKSVTPFKPSSLRIIIQSFTLFRQRLPKVLLFSSRIKLQGFTQDRIKENIDIWVHMLWWMINLLAAHGALWGTGDTYISELNELTNRLSGINQTIDRITYCQTQAYESIPELMKNIRKKYGTYSEKNPGSLGDLFGSRTRYKKLFQQDIIGKEKKLKDRYYVFYHAYTNNLRVAQDIGYELCILAKKCTQTDAFVMLRNFGPQFFGMPTLSQWMIDKSHYLKTRGSQMALNYQPDVKLFLLSVNLSFYGSTWGSGENTFYYFIKNHSHALPNFDILYDGMISPYLKNPSKKQTYIDRLKKLQNKIKTPEGLILQIFVKKDLVNQIAYISEANGFYWPYKLTHVPALDPYWFTNQYGSWYNESQPVLDQFVSAGFPLNYNISHIYGGPENVMNLMQGRILLKGEYFAKPLNNDRILMYRYSTLDKVREDAYKQELHALAKEIIS